MGDAATGRVAEEGCAVLRKGYPRDLRVAGPVYHCVKCAETKLWIVRWSVMLPSPGTGSDSRVNILTSSWRVDLITRPIRPWVRRASRWAVW